MFGLFKKFKEKMRMEIREEFEEFKKDLNKKTIEALEKSLEKLKEENALKQTEKFSKPQKISIKPKKHLKKILEFAQYLGTKEDNRRKNQYGFYPIHSFIKILTDKIMIDRLSEIIIKKHLDIGDNCTPICAFFSNDKNFKKMINPYFEEIQTVELEINLANFPVLAHIRREDKIKDCFKDIPEIRGKWEEDLVLHNHQTTLYLPLGLTVAYNGNHSIATGKFKACGILSINHDSFHTVRSMKKIYDVLKFDGENYIYADGEIQEITPAINFEFGCIFEIRRMLLKEKMPFCGYLSDGTKIKNEVNDL